ncbi:MAG TPA: glycosyltransferase family 2 protein [Blastocatellia bacterium]|jgi:glycosyltransferase involved in cell wall biosynthesis|nr:glycosyltransferase family 2 protein [Blastocatellia bacterium]
MGENPDVSIIVSTYNRGEVLRGALERMLAQEAEGIDYEIIAVDNNSPDNTRSVIESMIERGHENLRYVFEPRQGVSYGRNTGMSNARAPIFAFTDDDVRVSPDWVATIKRTFDARPEIDFLGGKVLPMHGVSMPAWLTRKQWAPLAIVDYGEAPFYVDSGNMLCLVGANLAFRRKAVETLGPFAADVQRVKGGIGSLEDVELQVRSWKAGGKGLYVPELITFAEVPEERLVKRYHRRWHTGHGHFYAIMRLEEFERSGRRPLFEVPAHLYKQALRDACAWAVQVCMGRGTKAFELETRLRFFSGFFRKRRKDFLAGRSKSSARELLEFARSLTHRKNSPRARAAG